MAASGGETNVAVLLVELGALLFGLGVLGRFARRFNVPVIPLYLLAGLCFGQGGVLSLSASHDFVQVAADIGVILLLVMLGLEYSADELRTSLRAQAPIGVLDGLLNAVPGAALALIAGWGATAAVALAGVTWVSSSGVIAKMLGDSGRLGNRETPAVLGVLVIEDLAMALYLPVLTALLAGGGAGKIALTVSIAVATVGAVIVVAIRFGRHVTALVSARDNESLLLGVLGLTLLVAGLADELKVSAAVGAFLVGIAVSGTVARTAAEVLAPLRDVFAAVFFVFFGLSTNPSKLLPVLPLALALAVVTAATKMATGFVAARRAGVKRRGRWRAAVTLIPRGEFSVVVAVLAVGAGAEARLGPTAAAYVLLTILTARWCTGGRIGYVRNNPPPDERCAWRDRDRATAPHVRHDHGGGSQPRSGQGSPRHPAAHAAARLADHPGEPLRGRAVRREGVSDVGRRARAARAGRRVPAVRRRGRDRATGRRRRRDRRVAAAGHRLARGPGHRRPGRHRLRRGPLPGRRAGQVRTGRAVTRVGRRTPAA